MISKQTALELIRYGLAGLTNTVVGLVIYVSCITLLSTPFWLANAAAILGGLGCGYFLSKKFVFTSSRHGSKGSAPRYIAVIALQFIVTTLMIHSLILMGQNEVFSYLLTLPVAIALSFGLQKLWVFRTGNHEVKA